MNETGASLTRPAFMFQTMRT